jgi:hypothetical protein
LAARIGALHAGLGDFPALRATHPDWLWLDPEDGQHPGLDLTLLMALRTLRRLYQQSLPARAVSLAYRDYRGPDAPRLESLASAQFAGLSSQQRPLDASDFEARLRAAGASLPAGVDSA